VCWRIPSPCHSPQCCIKDGEELQQTIIAINLLLDNSACERVLTALVFRYLCQGWQITHHPYDASISKKKKKGEIAFQHTCYLLDGGWGDGRNHWLRGVGFAEVCHS
jgi:hypothetical protein